MSSVYVCSLSTGSSVSSPRRSRNDAKPQSEAQSNLEMATTEDAAFAQGMFVTLWPKIERCHDYVELLLAAQEKLQQTVDVLIAGLQEAEKAEGSSLVSYADRLRNFPSRVERLQKKLTRIQDRLMAMKESPGKSKTMFSAEEMAVYASPLF
ncbi:Soluble NSF attachment domain-containing proteinin Pallidin [Phytophthora infestans]|nr:Soluble NSF attachment domain-containing proteinin Pallidin [Phytophthora infestans]